MTRQVLSPLFHPASSRRLPLPPRVRGRFPHTAFAEARRDPVKLYLEAWRRHGDLVRFQSLHHFWYLAVHPDAVEHVLQRRRDNYRKPDVLLRPLEWLLGAGGLFTSEGETWRVQRQMAQQAFGAQEREYWATAAAAAVRETQAEWEQTAPGTVVNVSEAMMRLALRIVWRVLCGAGHDSDYAVLSQSVDDALARVRYWISHPFAMPAWVSTPRNQRFAQDRTILVNAIDSLLAQDCRARDGSPDLVTMLRAALRRGGEVDERHLRQLVLTLVIAGSESVGTVLAWLWALLGRHPEVQGKMSGELHAVLAGRSPSGADLDRLPYTRMVFAEGLRLYPTGWIQPREALDDDVIQGFAVPRGTVIVLFQYLTHRHPDFWEEPEAFVPERFTPERMASQHRFAYLPFGAGPHTCIGRPMALVAGPLALAALAQRFRVDLPSDRLPDPSGTFFIRPSEPIRVALYPR